MESVKFIIVLSLLAGSSSAPMDASACSSLKPEDSAVVASCCAFVVPFTNETMESCGKKETSGTLSKEYECIQDCLFASDGVLDADKKFDPAAWKKHAMNVVPGDWKEVVANSGENCDRFIQTVGGAMEKKCKTSGSDLPFNCMSMQWYINCPTSSWTSSEPCNASKKKMEACFGPLFQKS